MGFASYDIVGAGKSWCIMHNGTREGDYATPEAAFESAVAAASLALREGHEVSVTVKGQPAADAPVGVEPLSTLMPDQTTP